MPMVSMPTTRFFEIEENFMVGLTAGTAHEAKVKVNVDLYSALS